MTTTIIIPTRNEARNLIHLVSELLDLVSDVSILVVDDDSSDGTADVAETMECKVLRRKNKRGLSSAVIDGIRLCNTKKIIVMDGDLQHPPELVPKMIEELDTHDLVVASRYCKGGSVGNMNIIRRTLSLVTNLMALFLAPHISDRLTGYFGFRRECIDDPSILVSWGYKILLQLLVKGKYHSVKEIPLNILPRRDGNTKVSIVKMTLTYLVDTSLLYMWKFRWLRFGLVGLLGVVIHLPVLYVLTEFAGIHYVLSAVISIVIASTNNYVFNNLWTFSERKKDSFSSQLRGWLQYQAISGITDGLYLGILVLLTEVAGTWYMLSAILSMLIVFVVKFIVANKWIWRKQCYPSISE